MPVVPASASVSIFASQHRTDVDLRNFSGAKHCPRVQASTLGNALPHSAGVVRPMTTIDELFGDYAGFVWRTLRHFGVQHADLEDQTQEVFLVVQRQFSKWDGEHPRSWLFAIARRCAAAYRRRSHRRHEQAVDRVPEGIDPHDPTTRAQLDRLNRVFQTLDEDKQIVFVLHEVEEMSMREVAEAVGCPLQTAYSRYQAARRDLLRALQEAK